MVAAETAGTATEPANVGTMSMAARRPRNHWEREDFIWAEYSTHAHKALQERKKVFTLRGAECRRFDHAGMAKLVDALALGASGATH